MNTDTQATPVKAPVMAPKPHEPREFFVVRPRNVHELEYLMRTTTGLDWSPKRSFAHMASFGECQALIAQVRLTNPCAVIFIANDSYINQLYK
jgi:hypothetical protein